MPSGRGSVAADLPEWDTGRVVALPSGTVTFLFTDIEGSTRLWEEHPEAMRDALVRHDEVLREAIESHGGYVVKTTGDGFHAAFATADAGMSAAVAAQTVLEGTTWGATGKLRVRMGLHTGTASLRDGDYFGGSLNRAARLMGVAHGGQIVVSQTTADLASDGLPAGVGLVDLGEHRLRDLSRPERVFQVFAPGLDREFPRLTSLDAFPGNLPAQVTSFIGRREEIAAVVRALDAARLVTLTGAGGVGKTRLAIHAAAEALPAFCDGAWFCELAAAGDPDALVQVVAAALGVQPHPEVPLDARVREVLRDREVLMVLDNCEHLLDAVSGFAEGLLRSCPAVRILATSREPLDIGGERVSRVRSLAVPDVAAAVARGDETDAMRLFVDRARDSEPDFAVGPSDGATVAAICRRVDGIPLAIELAAARVVSLSLGEILELLDERFRLLTGGRRTAVERHQTLRATVDWSYSLLRPHEQAVFDRLGVFPASFDATAARAVAAGDGVEDWDVLDALNGLVKKSMVSTVPATRSATRYQLLETMRQYAREHLEQGGVADRYRRAHAEHYALFAERVSEAFASGRDTARMWAGSMLELDNYRAAVTWALDSERSGDVDLALRITVRLSGAGPVQRRAAGVIAQTEQLLARAESASPELRAGVLAGMSADALFLRGDQVAAEALARRALAEGPTAGGALAITYTTLSMCAGIGGDHDRAVQVLVDGQENMRQLGFGTFHNDAFFESLIATAEALRGDAVAARAHATEAVRLARQAELPMRLGAALTTYARVCRRDDPDAADDALDEVLAMGPDAAGAWMLGWALTVRAESRFVVGDMFSALTLLKEALTFLGDDASVLTLSRTAILSATIFAALDEPETAAVLAGAATGSRNARFLNYAVDPAIRSDFESAVEHVRASLGAEAYDTAAARGTTMSSDDLLRVLLKATDVALDAAHE
jgi:predicted ATPase/class 3 adenylate cyclase